MIKQNNMNNKNNMLALSQERFSARKFTSEAVSQEDLDYIMECVRLAPSAVNRQPLHEYLAAHQGLTAVVAAPVGTQA